MLPKPYGFKECPFCGAVNTQENPRIIRMETDTELIKDFEDVELPCGHLEQKEIIVNRPTYYCWCSACHAVIYGRSWRGAKMAWNKKRHYEEAKDGSR